MNPQLEFSDLPLPDLVSREMEGQSAGIVTDSYHINRVSQFPNCEVTVVSPNEVRRISELVRQKGWDVLIGMGGCRALDMARLIADPNNELILIPTILSTSCISSAHSVIYGDNDSYSQKTVLPNRVIVPLDWIEKDNQDLQNYYFAAGAGDLMAEMSAAVQLNWEKYLKDGEMPKMDPSDFPLLKFLKSFKSLDRETVIAFAKELHRHSEQDWTSGESHAHVAGEHELYYQMFIKQKYSHNKPTHGALVSIGTLLSAWLVGDINKDYSLFEEVKSVYANIGLPTTIAGLEDIGVKKEHILEGIEALKQRKSGSLLCKTNAVTLDRVYC